jgi:hypothetical protein
MKEKKYTREWVNYVNKINKKWNLPKIKMVPNPDYKK